MHILEFETRVINGFIKLPQEYEEFFDSDAKVVVQIPKNEYFTENPQKITQILDFAKFNINCFDNINPVEYQRKIRDAKQ